MSNVNCQGENTIEASPHTITLSNGLSLIGPVYTLHNRSNQISQSENRASVADIGQNSDIEKKKEGLSEVFYVHHP